MVIPFYRAMRLIHLTTPGPVGLAALYVAAVLANLTRRPGWHLVERWNWSCPGSVET